MEDALKIITDNLTSSTGSLMTAFLAVVGALITLGVVSQGAKWLWRKVKTWLSAT